MKGKIIRPAARVKQGQLTLYTTSLRASDLLTTGFYDIDRLDPADMHDRGYQRVLNASRAKRLADYLIAGQEHHDAFLPTSIFLATENELQFDEGKNELEIDLAKVGPFNVVDGQHRLEGLRVAAEKDERIHTFEVPVNIAVGLSNIAQMCHFLIVNTTQKSVEKGVEQRLLARLTDMLEVEEVPTLPKWIRRVVETGDDSQAIKFVDFLNTTPGSVWRGRIAIPNQPAPNTSINQKSFVSSIKKYVLTGANPLGARPLEQQQRILMNYWNAIHAEIGSEEETVLFKSIGVDLFCRFSGTVFTKLEAIRDFQVATIRGVIRRAFDNMEGEYAGLGHSEWWLSGTGQAGSVNAAALSKINQELSRALHRSDGVGDVAL